MLEILPSELWRSRWKVRISIFCICLCVMLVPIIYISIPIEIPYMFLALEAPTLVWRLLVCYCICRLIESEFQHRANDVPFWYSTPISSEVVILQIAWKIFTLIIIPILIATILGLILSSILHYFLKLSDDIRFNVSAYDLFSFIKYFNFAHQAQAAPKAGGLPHGHVLVVARAVAACACCPLAASALGSAGRLTAQPLASGALRCDML